ncbi:hypothetical protein [Francisella sp. 19X1-34]|uniref:hypothetical protein n=1 Tax=Francisella sp. 19X1-34 TaxID=3087177 RepID=UPI002E32950C|nr:hypothetical protein [Francisella sp. 19X1-34]MED7788581.1 hypothetical protein [Francisella sp. 19X1-34]
MKKTILALSLSIFALSAYADSGENSLLALKGKDAFKYEKLYKENLVVYNCAEDANVTKTQSMDMAKPKRCQQHYANMIKNINKEFGISGVTVKDIESSKVNKHITQEASKYINQHLNDLMDKKDIHSEQLQKFTNTKDQNS